MDAYELNDTEHAEYQHYLDNCRHEHEVRPITATCDGFLCGMTTTGTAKDLEALGWTLGRFSTWCGSHGRGQC